MKTRVHARDVFYGNLTGCLGTVIGQVMMGLCVFVPPQFAPAARAQLSETKIVASDGADGDFFGGAIDIDGNVAVVGVRTADISDVVNVGAAYVFERIDGEWKEVQKLIADRGRQQDFFGESVAIEGDTILIGALGNDDRAEQGGAVYVFDRLDGVWQQMRILFPDDPRDFQFFGWEIALDGDRAVIGAPRDDEVAIQAGAVYVFERANGEWIEIQKILPNSPNASFFGTAIGLDGDDLIVGSPTDDEAGPQAGAAYVFRRNRGLWVPIQKLLAPSRPPPDSVESDTFARELALDGEWALVGSGDDERCIEKELFDPESPNFCASGAVFAYRRQANGRWDLQQKIAPEELEQFDFFGFIAIAIEGNRAVVGARGDDDACPDPPPTDPLFCDTGAVYLFERIDGEWQQINKLTASDAEWADILGGAFFGQGRPLGISGSHVIAGAPTAGFGENPRPNLGAAYIFKMFNRDPVAQDDRATTSRRTPVTIDVRANDRDADFDALTVSIAARPPNGIATANADGTITYTGTAGFSGEDTFSYVIDDGDGGIDVATVRVDVAACGPGDRPDGDFDRDRDVDLGDFLAFQSCFRLAETAPRATDACLCAFDADGDGDIDLADFLAWVASSRSRAGT